MIRVCFFRRSGRVAGFSVKGHAGYAEAGNDIVCAGVSSAVQTASNTITEAAGVPARVSVRGGTVTLLLPHTLSEKESALCGVVLQGLRLQLTTLAAEFPGRIRVRDSLAGRQE